MRAFQVFGYMTQEHAIEFFRTLAKASPVMAKQAVFAAASALKSRPTYLQKQPLEKRAAAVRRALSRVASNAAAEEILAVYFLEARRELLEKWLDGAGVAHDEGTLEEDIPPEPPAEQLKSAVNAFLGEDDDPDRLLLLRAFAAQSAIDWPVLNAEIEPASPDHSG